HPYGWLLRLRERARDLIERLLPEPEASLLAGIVLGLERGISPEVRDAFSATGAAHVIAISGFNMAVVSGAIVAGLSRFPLRRAVVLGLGAAFILLYTVFVGANPAATRAALMTSVLLAGSAFQRQAYVPASLALVALV